VGNARWHFSESQPKFSATKERHGRSHTWQDAENETDVGPERPESEMIMSILLAVLAILSALWAIVSSLVIAAFLSNRGVKINYVFFKVLMIRYIHQYRKITMQESGRPGPWFYSFVISINLALVLGIVAIVLRNI